MTVIGDERPCQRCIKRNLQDACHDGVRKKAKYLHDTPTEALLPGVGARGTGSQFLVLTNLGQGQQLPPDPGYPVSSANTVVYAHQQTPSTEYSPYAPNRPHIQMPPPLTDTMMSGQSFSTQQSPISPNFNTGSTHQASPMQSMAGVLQQGTSSPMRTPFSPIFDPNDPMQYSFDPSSFNFGNHYGAVEFGMLAHMSSGAADTPPSDCAVQINQTSGAGYTTPGTISTGYSGSPVNPQTFIYPQQQHLNEWPNDAASALKQGGNTYNSLSGRKRELANVLIKQEPPHGYAIGANSGSFTSPSSDSSPQDMMPGFDESPTTLYANNGSNLNLARSADPSETSTPYLKPQPLPPNRRSRDPSAVYERVTEPYSYTTGFHGLTAFIQRRFSPQKTLRIAKALASIRPSFISCTKNLNLEDLVFMEKCFQRSLWEYENFISGIATPTLVCRRTGEVAAVGKEFSLLTGWKKSVLLGNEPNLNVNTGGPYNPSEYSQPVPNVIKRVDGTMAYQPVFVAELFDDETAIDFYEAFAQLAFGDSRGSVTAQAKLLHYKTVDDYAAETAESAATTDSDIGSRANPKKRRLTDSKPKGVETGAYPLPDKDGKMECTYCWTVKRDMFDIPMLIVMNVSSLTSLHFGLLLCALPAVSVWNFLLTHTHLYSSSYPGYEMP